MLYTITQNTQKTHMYLDILPSACDNRNSVALILPPGL